MIISHYFFESLYLVIRLRSRKLGEPVRRGIEGERDRLLFEGGAEVSDDLDESEDEESELEESSSESDDELESVSESELELELEESEEELSES